MPERLWHYGFRILCGLIFFFLIFPLVVVIPLSFNAVPFFTFTKEMLALDPERRVPVQWHGATKGRHSGEVQIICTDQMGMLAEIGAVCKSTGINVTRMEAHTMDDDRAHLTLEVSVTDVDELSALMRSLEKINGIIRVDRLRA